MAGLINNGLFGGRPGCEAQLLVFLEELKYDTSYCAQRTQFNFDNDATSCYDGIIVALASIINRKYGLHRQVVAVHANTLQQAKFLGRNAGGSTVETLMLFMLVVMVAGRKWWLDRNGGGRTEMVVGRRWRLDDDGSRMMMVVGRIWRLDAEGLLADKM